MCRDSDVCDLVSYHLPDLIAALAADRTAVEILIFEGERKADIVSAKDGNSGIVATSIPTGCKNYGPYFADARVVIFPDKDEAGRKYRDGVARRIHRHAASVRVAQLDGLGDGEDIIDWARKPERKPE